MKPRRFGPARLTTTQNPRHDGHIQDAIRRELERSPKPLSVYGIALATGLKMQQVRSAINRMLAGQGVVVSVKQGNVTKYQLYRRATPKESGVVAGRITIGRGMRWSAW